MFFTIIILVFFLGILIFIHELGHFLFAKFYRVHIHEFSLGVGPKLISINLFGTPFTLRLFPFGGYVSLAGEVEDEGPGSFVRLKFFQQAFVILGGIIFNLLLTYVVLFPYFLYKPKQILPANIGKPLFAKVKTLQSLLVIEEIMDDSELKNNVNSQELPLLLVSVDNKSVTKFEELQEILRTKKAGQLIEMGYCVKFNIDDYVENNMQCNMHTINVHLNEKGKIGINLLEMQFSIWQYDSFFVLLRPVLVMADTTYVSIGFLKAIIANAMKKHDATVLEYTVGGPISIIPLIDTILHNKTDLILQLSFLLGMFSLNLALINALPFPGLDGWHLVLSFLRIIIGKHKVFRYFKYLTLLGLLVLFIFAIIITIKDINVLLSIYGR